MRIAYNHDFELCCVSEICHITSVWGIRDTAVKHKYNGFSFNLYQYLYVFVVGVDRTFCATHFCASVIEVL